MDDDQATSTVIQDTVTGVDHIGIPYRFFSCRKSIRGGETYGNKRKKTKTNSTKRIRR